MVELVGIEFYKLLEEVKPVIENSIIRKVYYIKEKNSLILSLYKRGLGNFYFYILLNDRVFFYSKSKYFQQTKTNKIQEFLRKHLKGLYINKVDQVGFDRILKFTTNSFNIYIEFLKPANIILTDSNNKILFLFHKYKSKDRILDINLNYTYPKNLRLYNPLEVLNYDQILNYLKSKYTNKRVGQVIAIEFGLGKKYTNLILEKLGIDRNKDVSLISLKDVSKIIKEIINLINYKVSIKDNDVLLDKRGSYTINEALNILYKNYFQIETRGDKVKEDVLESRKKELENTIKSLEEKANKIKIYLPILEEVRIKLLAGMEVEGAKRRGSKFTYNDIELDINKKVSKQLEEIYEKIKKLKKKIENIDKLSKEKKKAKLKIKFSNKWYEKFYFFRTTEGLLAIAGKNAEQNEVIIKKYFEEGDLGFHANIHGSPFAILKNGIKANKESIEETARFVGVYSRAWKEGYYSVDVYYFTKNQVSKEAPSGEYLPKGSFMIYGEKKWVKNVDLFFIIGLKGKNIIWGFSNKLKKILDKYVVILPGKEYNKVELAKKVEEILNVDRRSLFKILPDGGFIEVYP